MTDLITRLEQAEAGSRELDAMFARVVAKPSTLLNGMTYDDALDRFPNDLVGIARNWPIPAYTSSLDAIVALIGEKLPGWNVTIRIPSDPKHRHVCEVGAPDNPDASITDPWPFRASAGGSNAPLACAAALLRAIKEGEHG